ncbi:MAG TPA: penicillin acylase family protein [Solirubrobacterales bacterium]|nr:penicillin acylase family protein [Solirubrobacterales bacterium]
MVRRSSLRAFLALLACLVAGAAFAGTALANAVQPYGTNDAGGFRNVLPPGENGLDTLPQVLEFKSSKSIPNHFDDQQPLYENLLYGAPTLTDETIPNYFKDATFGVAPGEVESTIEPKPGVTILRDKAYGIPHIYGETRADTMFGAGYAGAADRLFLMDVLRHTGRAESASFLGGSNAASDAGQWAFAPYTEADLEEQIHEMETEHGAAGKQAVEDIDSYVEGINAYVAAAGLDPKLKPAEYSFINKPMEPWKPTDIIAIASLVGGIFGKGGGNELHSALTMEAMVERMGKKAGRAAWEGFRSKNDPEAPTTIAKPFPYETRSAFAKRGLALPEPKSVYEPPIASGSEAGEGTAGLNTVGGRLTRGLEEAGHASNWELVSAKHSADGHPIAVMGPQVGYYVPQILMEEDLHGPGIDARGAAFPGVNLYVELGHGRDYAWSATTATSDNVDTFAEVLCKDKFHYLYKGRCLKMEKLTKTESWTPNTIDQTPAGSQKLTAYRTVHGIVFARGKADGKKVAFVHARSTYFHEADSVIGFGELNEPGVVTGVKGFKKAISNINFLFNWSYVDANHIAYALSGAMPQRARGTSPDFPILGTGQYDWKGFDPKTHSAEWLPFAKHPQAVDPASGYLVSWNNKQAPEWAAADDNYSYGPVQRQQMIADHIRNDIKGGKKMTIAQLVQAMEEPATEDLRADKVLPILLKAIGTPKSAKLKSALAELKTWRSHGAHRRDMDRNGEDEETPAIELMDAWWPKLLEAEFKPVLGPKAYEDLEGMLETGSYTGGSPTEPSFDDGWWGFVSKDLRDVMGPTPKAPWSRGYCGGGSKAKCRQVLEKSLAAALKVKPAALYGGGDGACASNPQPSCFDANRPQETSGIELGSFPFQNRPTFQQVVTLTQKLGR